MMSDRHIILSKKQKEYLKKATHRWNGRIGATQCGKTFLDALCTIPKRLVERRGKQGINLIIGVTKSTIERNVLTPMRKAYGDILVTEIGSKNTARIFGELVHCLGADNVGRVKTFRGLQAKYLYIDEIVDIHEEVFEILPSRLSLDYSVCDFTGNPKYPDHWAKRFIDSDVDIYCQHLTIFDNPFLSKETVANLLRDYPEGSVGRQRNIYGEWVMAEGLIYNLFADNNSRFIKEPPKYGKVVIGVDWGHSQSANTAVAVLCAGNAYYVIDEYYVKDSKLDHEGFYKKLVPWATNIRRQYGGVSVFADCAELMSVNGLRKHFNANGVSSVVEPCVKHEILDRISWTCSAFSQDRLFVSPKCKLTIKAFNGAMWDSKKPDERMDNTGMSFNPVDMLDSFEYALCREVSRELRRGGGISGGKLEF